MAALRYAADSKVVVDEMSSIMSDCKAVRIELELIEQYFKIVAIHDASRSRHIHDVGEWLASIAVFDPLYALEAAEALLRHATELDTWQGEPYTQLMTALFREAEERELSDHGSFLSRVVAVQDALLRLGISSLEEWLSDAERP